MTNLETRPATIDDAVHLAALVDIAGDGLPVRLWQEAAAPGQSAIEIGRSRAMREAGGFSFRNAHVAAIGGAVAGLLLGYPLTGEEDPAAAPPQVRGLVELELEVPRHWYVNILAVYPEFRGRGIGGSLLRLADAIGAKACPDGMAIIVASANNGARRLYERHGYRFAGRRPAPAYPGGRGSSEWLLLTKPHG